MAKFILNTEGQTTRTVDYPWSDQPEILIVDKVFYIRYGEYLYRPAKVVVFPRNEVVLPTGDRQLLSIPPKEETDKVELGLL